MDAMLSELRTQAESEKIRLSSDKEKLETAMALSGKKRIRLTKGINSQTLRTYERIRNRFADGMAFIPAHRERCTACKMMIPNVIYMQLMKGRDVLACESCSRLLYWSGHFPKDAAKLEPIPKEAPAPAPKAAKKAAKKKAAKKTAKKTAKKKVTKKAAKKAAAAEAAAAGAAETSEETVEKTAEETQAAS
jgi:hypothetical protein